IVSYAQPQGGSIKGKVFDEVKDGFPFVNVALFQNGNIRGGATTDFNGVFKISNISAGSYTLEIKFVGYQTYRLEGLIVKGGKLLPLSPIYLKEATELLKEVEIVSYKVPLIDKDGGASGGTVTREDLARMPGRSAASIASTVGGVQSDANGEITSVRGSRDDATFYYIDGIKVRGSTNLPKSAIEEVSVMTGGVPANFGDATGGIISITTRGASRVYFGGVEAVSSGLAFGEDVYGLDNNGFNLLEATFSGPLLMKKDSTGKKTDPILGFFVSGNFNHVLDPRPLAIDQYRLRPSLRDSLIDPDKLGPLRPTGLGFGAYYNTDFLNSDAFEKVNYRQNVARTRASLAGKIDVNAGPNMNISFGASGAYSDRNGASWESSLMNYDNLANYRDIDWRAYGKFTQRFQNVAEDESSQGGVKNAYYTIMVDYSKNYGWVQDNEHKDNYFNYGHIGKFDIYKTPSFEFSDFDGNGVLDFVQTGVNDDSIQFTPSTSNADMAAITNQYFTLYDEVAGNYENTTQLLDGGALLNGRRPTNVYGLWRNIGYGYNGSNRTDNTQFRITAVGSADIGDHAISLGFEYEQRTDRYFGVAPIGLWTIMRQLANSHTDYGRGIDESQPIYNNFGSFTQIGFETLNTAPGEFSGSDPQSFFDYNLRNSLGLDPDGTEFINIDAMDPSEFSLSMFSADELLNSGDNYVTYYGYDHTGEKINGRPSFDDFFTKKDQYGNYTRPIGAFEPIYIAGYIMDKFAFDDLIFNVGVRIDRYDANQQVLKDDFSLYPTRTVGEVNDVNGQAVSHPTNIPSSATVYINDIEDPTTVMGYRDGNQWFSSDGVAVNDLESITPSGYVVPQPYLVQGVSTDDDVSSSAFEDYKPQINIMPRIAFSFPISDEALFFAHYDVLTKRPTTGNRLNPIHYFYLQTGNIDRVNNPSLLPEKTIDYEIGFQQVLNTRSSLKISGFYREQRNQVALVNKIGAFPQTYSTWGNIDFGTIKGLTIGYDLRRTGNMSMRASYTLQFADGTGSNPTAAANLIASDQPNLRTIYPYT
ncbi:MAG: carboxypeptidase-like regulatory domain-containing protein, partial [Flavobacteriales bacterium]|nr:carboxypeptidase-like regulatory domain-containing protein [Flavobacteriales bacterium]